MASKVRDWLESLPNPALCKDPEEIDSAHSEDDVDYDSEDYNDVNEAPYIDSKEPDNVTFEDDMEYDSDIYDTVDAAPYMDPKVLDSVSSVDELDYDIKVPTVINKFVQGTALCDLNMVCKKRRLWQASLGDQLPGMNREDRDSVPSGDSFEYRGRNEFFEAPIFECTTDIPHVTESDTDSDISGLDDLFAELEALLNDVDSVTGQDASGDDVHSVDLRGQLHSDMGPGRDMSVPPMEPSMDPSVNPSMDPSMDLQMPFNGAPLDLLAFVAVNMSYM